MQSLHFVFIADFVGLVRARSLISLDRGIALLALGEAESLGAFGGSSEGLVMEVVFARSRFKHY